MADGEEALNQLDADIRELIRAGYLRIDEDGRFSPTIAGHLQAGPQEPAA